MENFTLASAASIEAAVATAQQADTKFIAGGTDLLQLMKDNVERPLRLVDIEVLPLDTYSIGADGARIGALVKMSTLGDDPGLRQQYPAIAEALLASASPQVRNMATIGGNLLQRTRCGYFRDPGVAACNKRQPGSGCSAILGFNRLHAVLGSSDFCIATHPSDLAVALTALDAAIEVQGSSGPRTVPITQFYVLPGDTPQRETVLQPGELITAVLLPPPGEGERSHYLKLRDRASFEFALVSAAVAVAVADGHIAGARVAVGGVGTVPWRLRNVEQALTGAALTREALMEAAAHAAEGARPFPENRFKIPLMQRAVVRALMTVIA
ncbi:MAG: xanthine dehydrogenase family protein subunit M [Alphaproteobacteria bacterium]|nr:xanthine dehydrogenase family protein subunit M [Alphaproteobacteria bacterium]